MRSAKVARQTEPAVKAGSTCQARRSRMSVGQSAVPVSRPAAELVAASNFTWPARVNRQARRAAANHDNDERQRQHLRADGAKMHTANERDLKTRLNLQEWCLEYLFHYYCKSKPTPAVWGVVNEPGGCLPPRLSISRGPSSRPALSNWRHLGDSILSRGTRVLQLPAVSSPILQLAILLNRCKQTAGRVSL